MEDTPQENTAKTKDNKSKENIQSHDKFQM
jgi:hypothetical protein